MTEFCSLVCQFNTPFPASERWEERRQTAVPSPLKVGHFSNWLIIYIYIWRWIAKWIIDRDAVAFSEPLVVNMGPYRTVLCADERKDEDIVAGDYNNHCIYLYIYIFYISPTQLTCTTIIRCPRHATVGQKCTHIPLLTCMTLRKTIVSVLSPSWWSIPSPKPLH